MKVWGWAKEDNSGGKHVLCVRDQNIEKKPAKAEGKMFSISNSLQQHKKQAEREKEKKADGKMLRRITLCMCTIFWFVFCLI
jgi:hypothetical protein